MPEISSATKQFLGQVRPQRCIPFGIIGRKSQEYMKYLWSGNVYGFLYLSFGLGTQSFQESISVTCAIHYIKAELQRISYWQGILLLTFLLQISLKSLIQQSNRLSQIMDKCMSVSFSTKTKLLQPRQEMFSQLKFSFETLMKSTGLFSSSVQAILLIKIQFRYLQQKQMSVRIKSRE